MRKRIPTPGLRRLELERNLRRKHRALRRAYRSTTTTPGGCGTQIMRNGSLTPPILTHESVPLATRQHS